MGRAFAAGESKLVTRRPFGIAPPVGSPPYVSSGAVENNTPFGGGGC